MRDFDNSPIAPEPSIPFDWSAVEVDELLEEDRPIVTEFNRRAIICAILRIVTDGATTKSAGQRAFILAHLLKAGRCSRKMDLAKQLGVSPGRVSQVLKAVSKSIAALPLVGTDIDHPGS